MPHSIAKSGVKFELNKSEAKLDDKLAKVASKVSWALETVREAHWFWFEDAEGWSLESE